MTSDPKPSGISNWFLNDESFWMTCTIAFGFISLFKGLQLPNSWAATLAQLDYSQGFIKRGLFGATATVFFHLERYRNFALFSCAILCLLLGFLAWWTHRSIEQFRLGHWLIPAVFWSSYAISYLGQLNGYSDILLALVALVVLQIQRPLLRSLTAFPALAAALLIHEMFLFVFLPVILFSYALDAFYCETRRDRRIAFASAGALTLFAVALTFYVALHASLTPQATKLLQAEVSSKADFAILPDVFYVLNRSLVENLHVISKCARDAQWWFQHLWSFLVFSPCITIMMYCVYGLIPTCNNFTKRQVFTIFIVASLAPLSMNLFGNDVERWGALAVLTTFFCLLCVSRRFEDTKLVLSTPFQRLASVVIALNMACGGGLFGKRANSMYPFTNEIFQTIHAIHHTL